MICEVCGVVNKSWVNWGCPECVWKDYIIYDTCGHKADATGYADEHPGGERCDSCDGTGKVSCTHGLIDSHRYCSHYQNTTLNSHACCSHGKIEAHTN